MTNCTRCRHPECVHLPDGTCTIFIPQKPYGMEPDKQCDCLGFEGTE